MKTRAAVSWKVGDDWVVDEFELRDPKQGEVLVKLKYAGLCHSDEHVRLGDMTEAALPMCGGHEGAGVVEAVGPGVTRFEVGDHVATSFIPACGSCDPCANGMQNLCDRGAETMSSEPRLTSSDGTPVPSMAGLGTFADLMVVDQDSLVKVGKGYPLDAVALVSCGVATGWGSAVNIAKVEPGDVVVVVGVGGIGINAVQGAAAAGARAVVAVDPVEMKREFAQTMGATHSAESIEDARQLVDDISWGRMANSVILTVGTATSDLFGPAMTLVGKGGDLTLTSLSDIMQNDISVNTFDLAMQQKQIRGTVFGGCNPRSDIPRILRMYEDGKLKLDELITRRYKLEQINEGYAAMHAGENVRAVIEFDE